MKSTVVFAPPDLPSETILWVNDFEEDKTKELCQNILKISACDSRIPVMLYINSNGGRVDSLASIISVLDSIDNPIVTVAVGHAYSCGAMLLSHGDYRYVGTQARVMIHEISAGVVGNINDMKCDAKMIDRMNRDWMNWTARNCGKRNYKNLKRYLTTENRNHWMNAKEAVAFGIADHIGIPQLVESTQYSLRVKGA